MNNEELDQYIKSHTTREPELLFRLYRETYLKTVYPRMLSGHVQGRFLSMISHMIKPECVLEIGTFTGYATICLSEGLAKKGRIHTMDIDPELQDIFMKYFYEAGIKDKITAHTGNALNLIHETPDDIDLVFIDADKENYLNYYKAILPKVKSNGFLIADNTLWGGKVFHTDNDKETRGIIEFNEYVQNDNTTENVLVPLRDGLTIIRKY